MRDVRGHGPYPSSMGILLGIVAYPILKIIKKLKGKK